MKDPSFSKFHLIKELVTANQIFEFKYRYGWELQYYYSNRMNQIFIHHKKFPEEFLLKTQLKAEEGSMIYLKNFINNLDELISYEDNPYMIHKIKKLKDFYHDKKKAIKVFEEYQNQTKNDLLMIYRLRNLIVHSAHFDYTLLPYFAWKIESFTGNLLRKLIKDRSGKQFELNDILFDIFHRKERLFNDLNNNSIDLIND